MSRPMILILNVAIALMLFEGMASAQVDVSSAAPAGWAGLVKTDLPVDAARMREQPNLSPLRDSLNAIDFGPVASQRAAGPAVQATSSGRKRSALLRVLAGAIGATAGLFAGGYLGAAVEGDRCNCGDPGLQGALIGAPVGAVTGGVLGALFF
jgi:hypothetical protein